MAEVKALAASAAHGLLEPFSYDPGPLGAEEVDIAVEHCGICHSDLSMLDNEWGITAYPFVPGHEAIGRVVALGDTAAQKGLQIGQRVGVGWNASSCLHCEPCLSGDQQMCTTGQPTIVGRHGAFAQQVRSHWVWAVPIPDGVDPADAGPLLCGGVTVFAPIMDHVKPTDRVGVFGIGGLGHLAVMFLSKWGCDVTAFTSSPAKMGETRSFGATRTASSVDAAELKKLARTFDLLLIYGQRIARLERHHRHAQAQRPAAHRGRRPGAHPGVGVPAAGQPVSRRLTQWQPQPNRQNAAPLRPAPSP